MEAFVTLFQSLASSTISDSILELLTANLFDSCSMLRNTALKALSSLSSFPPDVPTLEVALLVARHDEEEDNGPLAEK